VLSLVTILAFKNRQALGLIFTIALYRDLKLRDLVKLCFLKLIMTKLDFKISGITLL